MSGVDTVVHQWSRGPVTAWPRRVGVSSHVILIVILIRTVPQSFAWQRSQHLLQPRLVSKAEGSESPTTVPQTASIQHVGPLLLNCYHFLHIHLFSQRVEDWIL